MGWSDQNVIAQLVIVEGANDGIFVYNGAPAKGSLILAIANGSGTDAYGNNYLSLLNAGVWSPSTGNMEQHFGIDANGKVYLADAFGTTKIYLDPSQAVMAVGSNPLSGSTAISIAQAAGNISGTSFPAGVALSGLPLLVYSGTPATGNLIASMSPTSGSDTFGNAYLQGIASYVGGSSTHTATVQLDPANNRIALYGTSGVGDGLQIQYEGGSGSLITGETSGVLAPARITMIPGSTTGQLVTDPIAAQNPGSATVPYVPEVWHTAALSAGGWAGNLRYRLRVENEVSLQADLLTVGASGTVVATLPAAYQPASEQRLPLITTGAAPGGSLPVAIIATNGQVTLSGITAGQLTASLNGRYPLD